MSQELLQEDQQADATQWAAALAKQDRTNNIKEQR
jgi:hypothetical protein